MKARRRRPSSRQRKRTRRHRCLGTRAFRLTRGSELVSPAVAELLRGATADPPLGPRPSTSLPPRLTPCLAVRRALVHHPSAGYRHTTRPAEVAELADAGDSKSPGLTPLGVRFPSSASMKPACWLAAVRRADGRSGPIVH